MKSFKDKKVVFMGTPEFAVPVFAMLCENFNVILCVTQPDKEVGRGQNIKFSSIKEYAISQNVPLFQPLKIRKDYQTILDLKPDIVITCAYGQIIPKEILDCPKYGCINVHASLLPKLRGGAPIHRAIIEGYKETGISIMYMNEKMDEGDIIIQKSIKIENTDNVGTLHDKLSDLGSKLLFDILESIFNGTNKRIKQNNDEATYGFNIKKEEEHLDFDNTSEHIYNKIRGLYPFPTSYILLNNEMIKICESYIGNNISEECGIIEHIYKDGIGVGTLDKEIVITRLKPSGKKEMAATDYINGKRKENLIGSRVC